MGRRRRNCYVHPHEILLETDLVVTISGQGGLTENYTVTLTQEKIILTSRNNAKLQSCLSSSSSTLEILSQDIVSVRPPHTADTVKYSKKRRLLWPVLLVVAYPGEGKAGRKKRSYYFQTCGRMASRREELLQVSQVWLEAVSEVCLGRLSPVCHLVPPPSSLPLLVILNPRSGRGRALQLWQKAAQVMSEAGRLYELVVTEGPGHARQIMLGLELAAWGGVVVVSGDGLVHEVYNGLLARPDWRLALQFCVGVLPAGTGNALVHSLVAAQGERPESDQGLLSQAVSVARGNTAPLDLFLVRGPTNDIRVGFLSLGWGLITDVDIDSEVIRWMGDLRLAVYGLIKVAAHKTYRATISYVLADWPDRRTTTLQVPIHPLDSEESDWTNSSLETGGFGGPRHHLPHLHHLHHQQGKVRLVASYADSWQELDQRLCNVNFVNNGRGGHFTLPHRREQKQQRRSSSHSRDYRDYRDSTSRSRSSTSPEKSRSSRSRSVSSPEKHRGGGGVSRKLLAPGPDTPLSATPTSLHPSVPPPVFPAGRPPSPSCDPAHSPLTATPLHKDWVSETSDFLSVMVLNLPYLARDFYAVPDCKPDDGVLWLMIVRQNVTRLGLLGLLAGLEEGSHVNTPGVDIFPVTALKISVGSTKHRNIRLITCHYSRTSKVFPPSWLSMVNSSLLVMFRSRCFLVPPE